MVTVVGLMFCGGCDKFFPPKDCSYQEPTLDQIFVLDLRGRLFAWNLRASSPEEKVGSVCSS